MGHMSDLEKLIVLEEIRDLKAPRIHALDTKDRETYEALHAPDPVPDNEGESPQPDLKKNARRLKSGLADLTTVHHLRSPVIESESPISATGIRAMEDNLYQQQDGENHWLRGNGFYHETYEKRDGRWVFTSHRLRRLKVLSSPGAVIGEYRAPRD